MFNLLLMLFLMANKPKIELQPVQQAVYQQTKPFTRDSMWYTNRPIDQRTQVRNVYLDSVKLNSSFFVEAMSLFDLSDASLSVLSWNLYRKKETNPMKVYFPTWWTYHINWRVFISQHLWVWLLNTFVQINSSLWEVFSSMAYKGTTIPINRIVNVKKWDYINIYFDAESDEDIEWSIQISIIKLS